jgi:leucyl aminopeptidase (aminopeptidase T)
MEMPEEYLGMASTYGLYESRIADCYIYTSSVQDPTLWADVPEEKAAIVRKAQDPLRYAYSLSYNRIVSLGQSGGIPSKAYAESIGADYNEMIAMFWKSIGTDFDKMLTSGKQISSLLKPESVLKLTTKEGTNLSFRISKNEPVLNTGRTNDTKIDSRAVATYLPAGEVYTTIDLMSAEGIMVIPRFDFRGIWVENLKLKFVKGTIVSVEADKHAELIKDFFEKHPESTKSLSVFDLGINTDSYPISNSKYVSFEMAGMICLFVGDNSWAGGDISTGASLNFFQPNATLTVDGKTLVKDGKLIMP